MADRKLKAVCVDDKLEIRNMVETVLRFNDIEPTMLDDGRLMVETARCVKPDFVILDLRMPEIDGWEVARQLREDSALKHIPIIVLTASGNTQDRALGNTLGVDAYLYKPFGVRELMTAVNKVIAKHFRRT
jgi:DNA-binding response OmpR family regulator